MKAGSAAVPQKVYRVQVLERAFAILGTLADEGEMGLAEAVLKLGLHKSTAHRLLMVLEAERFVEKCEGGKYRLGVRLIDLGLSAVSRLDVYRIAPPHLRELVDKTGETAHLAVLREGAIVSLVNVESQRTLRTPSTVGVRSPVHCTSLGKAILANLPEGQADKIIRKLSLKAYTSKTITTASRLRLELRMIRERGYAIDDEEREEGLRCLGAPVRDHSGAVVAAVSIAGPAFRIDRKRIQSLAASVVTAANSISAAMGHRPQ